MEARLFALQRHGDGHGAFVLVHLGLIICRAQRPERRRRAVAHPGQLGMDPVLRAVRGLRPSTCPSACATSWSNGCGWAGAASCIGLAFGVTILFLGLRAVAAVGGLLQ